MEVKQKIAHVCKLEGNIGDVDWIVGMAIQLPVTVGVVEDTLRVCNGDRDRAEKLLVSCAHVGILPPLLDLPYLASLLRNNACKQTAHL